MGTHPGHVDTCSTDPPETLGIDEVEEETGNESPSTRAGAALVVDTVDIRAESIRSPPTLSPDMG